MPPSKGDAEAKLDQIPGVVESHLEAVCCDNGQTILYVGIEERGAPHFDLREPPEGEVALPEEIVSAYNRFLEAAQAASRRGSTDEDLTHGHPLMADGSARAIQEMFPALADTTSGADPRRAAQLRAMKRSAPWPPTFWSTPAARAAIVNDLQYALKDADAGVRNNAARSLVALSVLAKLDPVVGSPHFSHLVHRDAEFAFLVGSQPRALGAANLDRQPRSAGSGSACARGRSTH